MTSQPPWTVLFYTDARGEAPAMRFLDSLPLEEQTRAGKAIRLLIAFGVALGMPHARPVAGMWELRAGPNRLFYVGQRGRRFIILHGYRKQGQKAPKREIETARRRMQDFLSRGG